MPYIKQGDRARFSDLLLEIGDSNIKCAGELNYIITVLAIHYMELHGECYQNYNDVVGALECAKLELQRRKIEIYEEKKIQENGDVY